MDDFENVFPKLKNIELFKDFAPDTEENRRILKIVYENMTVRNFKKGDLIIKEGNSGDSFYILISGSVEVFRNTPAGDVIALAKLNSDQNIFFGETALISKEPRTATVKASSEVKTVVLSSKKFREICENEPMLGYRVVSCLARRMALTIRQTNSDKATLYEALFNEIEFGI